MKGAWILIVALLAGAAALLISRKASAEEAPSTDLAPLTPDDIIPPDNVSDVSETISVYPNASTRGERNNNPGNIMYRVLDQWNGLMGHDEDGYCIFKSYEYGIRADAILLRRYYYTYNLNTVRAIISRYAPPQANPTEAYIMNVASVMGVKDTDVINVGDDKVMLKLITGIIQQENGRIIYSQGNIAYGISLS
jgi:hypothetical protein